MRLAPDDVRRARLRRGSLVGVMCAAVASLVLSALVPHLEPWLGTPRASLLLLASAGTAASLLAFVGARNGAAWSSADDVAWVVALGVLSVLAGAGGSPVGLGMLFHCAALLMLAMRDPSSTLAIIACTTTAFIPVVRALILPGDPSVFGAMVVSTIATSSFVVAAKQTRRYARVLAEREALVNAHHARPSPSSEKTGSAATTQRNARAAATESSSHEGSDHGWDALVERVRTSITLMAENAGIAARVQAELGGLAPPSNKMRTNLLRIAQEATTQAIRHAEPRSITVTLRRAEGGVVFELQDDGIAGDGMRQRRSLATLRGRVAALGGTAEVQRAEGGWVTRVRLPCDQLN